MSYIRKAINNGTDWRTFLFISLVPQIFSALAFLLYIHGGGYYYISFGCLGATLILMSLSISCFLCKLIHLACEKRWRRFYIGLLTYASATTATLGIQLFYMFTKI